jgi:anti-sigma regulatory factor (Ser/Thr protein kinase)
MLTRMSRLELRPEPGSPRQARSFVRSALEEWGIDQPVIEDAELLVTEVVTNAVIHARTNITLEVSLQPEKLRFEVSDLDDRHVTRRQPTEREATGRGMFLVDSLATDWDVLYGETGKTVRFSLSLDRATERV